MIQIGSLPSLSSLRAGLRAWRGQLRDSIPLSFRRWYFEDDTLLGVVADENQFEFFSLGALGLVPCGTVETAGLDAAACRKAIAAKLGPRLSQTAGVFLCLPASRVFVREVDLPLAVEENLTEALTLELDRLTPFKPDQVRFDYRIVERNPAGKTLRVVLAVVPAELLTAQTAALADLGLPLRGATLAEFLSRDGRSCLNFLPAGGWSSRARWRLRINIALGLMVSALLAVALGLPVWQLREKAIAEEREMAQAKGQAFGADALRGELEKRVEEHNLIVRKKLDAPYVVPILNSLSALLPEDTWLTHFEFDGKDLQIQGEAPSASKVFSLIDQAPFVKSAAFKSPVVSMQSPTGTPTERFHIAAELKPLAPVPAPVPIAPPVPPAPASPPAAAKP